MTSNVFEQKSYKKKTTKQRRKQTNHCQSRDSNPDHLAPQPESLPLDNRHNLIEVKLFNCVNVMG